MDILISVLDLMEMDYNFTKVMLYVTPQKDLFMVLQKVDPILATSFYSWYVKNHGKEFLKGKDGVDVGTTSNFDNRYSLPFLCLGY